MSVLRQVMTERQEWGRRHEIMAATYHNLFVSALMFLAIVLFYLKHETLMQYVARLVN